MTKTTTKRERREPTHLDTLIAEVRRTARAMKRCADKADAARLAADATTMAYRAACDAVAADAKGVETP